jgi:hypothetical protein
MLYQTYPAVNERPTWPLERLRRYSHFGIVNLQVLYFIPLGRPLVAAAHIAVGPNDEEIPPTAMMNDIEVCRRLNAPEARHMGRFRSFLVRLDVYDKESILVQRRRSNAATQLALSCVRDLRSRPHEVPICVEVRSSTGSSVYEFIQ